MRVYIVSDEVGEWIDKWAAKEGDGGFQNMAAEIARSELGYYRGVMLEGLEAFQRGRLDGLRLAELAVQRLFSECERGEVDDG